MANGVGPNSTSVESDVPDLVTEEVPEKQALSTLENIANNLEGASRFAGGAITGFLDAGLNTAVDAAKLASGTVNTGIDMAVGPYVDLAEKGLSKITGKEIDAGPLLPDAQRGYSNYNEAAVAIEGAITSPGKVVDAILDPIKEDWEAGRKGEAMGRAAFEIGGVVLGVKGLNRAGTASDVVGGPNVDNIGGKALTAETDELSSTLKQTGGANQADPADEMYNAIRASETDVKNIAANTGFKESNVQKVKDHVFNDTHILDRHVDQGVPATQGRFDSNETQAEAWNRMEEGTHTEADITWMKHETAESWYEKKYNSGYSEAHDRVDGRWNGNPWEDK